MIIVGVSEAKASWSAITKLAASGELVSITRYGKQLAILCVATRQLKRVTAMRRQPMQLMSSRQARASLRALVRLAILRPVYIRRRKGRDVILM